MTSLAFLVLLFLAVGIINPAFLRLRNVLLSLNGSVVFIILAVGVAFVIITGEIDVSVAATLGFSAAVSAVMIRDNAPWMAALGAALLIGLLVGAANGIGVTVLRVPSIIMTLGTNGIVRGISYLYTNGKWVENVPFEFKALSQISVGGVTVFFISAMALSAVIFLLMSRTRWGRYFSAVGDNEAGATLIGIPVRGAKISSFLLSSALASLAGLAYVSRVGFVTPTAGSGYEMKAIAACVLGGISLSGGIGSVIGAAFGAMIMSSISRLLVFVGLSSNYDNAITGILLITIVLADALLQKHSKEKARRERLSAKTASAEAGSAQ
jgi:AI-2 transport system permease protein